MKGIYRNLNAKTINDRWSICNAHEYKGHVIRDTGVTHGINFALRDIIVTKPESIRKGCARIQKKGHREVIAMLGGTIHEEPIGAMAQDEGEYIGRLTLSIERHRFEVITPSGTVIEFNPSQSSIYFGEYAEVYI